MAYLLDREFVLGLRKSAFLVMRATGGFADLSLSVKSHIFLYENQVELNEIGIYF